MRVRAISGVVSIATCSPEPVPCSRHCPCCPVSPPACAASGDWTDWTPAQCPEPCEPDVLTTRCETDLLIEQRGVALRSRGTDGECSVLGVRRWEPECPPECEPVVRELECEGSDVVQVQERRAVRVGNVCTPTGEWSDPSPQCQPPIDLPEPCSDVVETRFCDRVGDADPVEQSRSSPAQRVDGECVAVGVWPEWTPDCPEPPPSCSRTQHETQVCSDDETVIQTRSRTEHAEGNVCVWNPGRSGLLIVWRLRRSVSPPHMVGPSPITFFTMGLPSTLVFVHSGLPRDKAVASFTCYVFDAGPILEAIHGVL